MMKLKSKNIIMYMLLSTTFISFRTSALIPGHCLRQGQAAKDIKANIE